jgi:hypothetical protein
VQGREQQRAGWPAGADGAKTPDPPRPGAFAAPSCCQSISMLLLGRCCCCEEKAAVWRACSAGGELGHCLGALRHRVLGQLTYGDSGARQGLLACLELCAFNWWLVATSNAAAHSQVPQQTHQEG